MTDRPLRTTQPMTWPGAFTFTVLCAMIAFCVWVIFGD